MAEESGGRQLPEQMSNENRTRPENMNPDNTVFVLLSFEGPDLYALAGGLGVRITHVARTLARKGYETHLFFVGDPRSPGREVLEGGKLILHRWCQWISEYYPGGVYEGEGAKLNDFNQSIPSWVLQNIVRPCAAQDKVVAVLAEEWPKPRRG